MAMMNPKGRVNYEPNSWPGAEGGPRECHETGFRSFPAVENGPKVRERSAKFADHYSQARQFYISQTSNEQGHIAGALIFELSKVERHDIRLRMVAHLPHIDPKLAAAVAKGLGIDGPIHPAVTAVEPRSDLKPSKALSIQRNPPKSFASRRVGVLVTGGVSRALFDSLKTSVEAEGATIEVVAPTISGVIADNGTLIESQQKIGGGPSVLYDAVAVLSSADGARMLLNNPAARDFVCDAFAHLKFVAYTEDAKLLFEKSGIVLDEGFIALSAASSVDAFVKACRKLRHWPREQSLAG